MKSINYILISLLAFTFFSCKNNSRQQHIDNADIKRIEIKIHRFDKDLISIDTKNASQSIKGLYKQYPEFLSLFTFNILEVEDADTAKVTNLLTQFVSHKTFGEVNKKVLETFSDVSDIEDDLSEGYTNIHALFPQIHIPEIYFFVSGFNRSVIMTDSILGVGTDFYLGADYAPYKEFTYDYLLYNMRREMVSIDVISATLFKNFTFDGKQNRLMDNMLHRGKVIYALHTILPDKKIEDILGYSDEQYKWASQYESEVWKALVGQKDLFSTNVQLINKYLNDAPFTAPITQESPGRLGVYIGWKIIESYMKNNKDITLQQLMKLNEYQLILEKSGYKP